MPDEIEWLTVADVAGRFGIAPSTWRSYVARDQAPKPDTWREVNGRIVALYRPETIDGWEGPRRTKAADDREP